LLNLMCCKTETRQAIEDVLWWHAATGNPVSWREVTEKGPSGRLSRVARISRVRGDIIRALRYRCGWEYLKIARAFEIDHTTAVHHAFAKAATRPINVTSYAPRKKRGHNENPCTCNASRHAPEAQHAAE